MTKPDHRSGQGLVEYALILVLVAVVVVAILLLLGPVVGNVFSNIVAGLEGSGEVVGGPPVSVIPNEAVLPGGVEEVIVGDFKQDPPPDPVATTDCGEVQPTTNKVSVVSWYENICGKWQLRIGVFPYGTPNSEYTYPPSFSPPPPAPESPAPASEDPEPVNQPPRPAGVAEEPPPSPSDEPVPDLFTPVGIGLSLFSGVTAIAGLGLYTLGRRWASWPAETMPAPVEAPELAELIILGEEDPCAEARRRCAGLRLIADAADERAAKARKEADEARDKCKEARERLKKAEAEAEAAENAKPDERDWIEREGKRRTSHDLKLKDAAARAAWSAYKRGDLPADEVMEEWKNLGEDAALDELRERDREAREARKQKAKEDVEAARKEVEALCKESELAEARAGQAEADATEARDYAEEICRAADECEDHRQSHPEEPPLLLLRDEPESWALPPVGALRLRLPVWYAPESTPTPTTPETPSEPEETCEVLVHEGWLMSMQGTYGDDYTFDGPQHRIQQLSPVSYFNELLKVKDRHTLMFGIFRAEPGLPPDPSRREKIVIKVRTRYTRDVFCKVVFTLFEGPGETARVIYETEPIYPVKLAGRCGPETESIVQVDAYYGAPPEGARDKWPPFTFRELGPYRLEAELVKENGAKTGLKIWELGNVVETRGPTTHFLPATFTATTVEETAELKAISDALADSSAEHIPDYFPIPPRTLATVKLPARDLTPVVEAVDDDWVGRIWRRIRHHRTFEEQRRDAVVAAVTRMYTSASILGKLGRLMVVLRRPDFESIKSGDAVAFAISQKLMFTRSDQDHTTVAHEIIHTMPFSWSDPQMIKKCGLTYHNRNDKKYANGFRIMSGDKEDRRFMRDYPSIMGSAVSPPLWINQISFWHLLSQLTGIPDPPLILIQGFIGRSAGQTDGSLSPAYQLEGEPDLEVGDGGEWAIVLRDPGGAELGRYPFDPVWTPPDTSTELSLLGFAYRVPELQGVARIELVGPDGLLDSLEYSDHAPTLTILSPSEGSVAPVEAGRVSVSWEGADEDGDELLYSVFYSPDGGDTWILQSFEQSSAAADVEVDLAGGEHQVKVIATDGVRSAEAVAGFRLAS